MMLAKVDAPSGRRAAPKHGNTRPLRDLSYMTLNKDFGFYACVGGCLLAATIVFALLVGGEISGPQVAQTPNHAIQSD